MKKILPLLAVTLIIVSCARHKSGESQASMAAAEENAMPKTVTEENAQEIPVVASDSSDDPFTEPVDEDALTAAEEERLGRQLDDLLAGGMSAPYAEDKDSNPEPVEKRLIDAQNRIKLHEYGNELLLPKSQNGRRELVRSVGKLVERRFYDERWRLSVCELWSIPSVADAARLQSERFEYEGDSFTPAQKITESDAAKSVDVYDGGGHVLRSDRYKKDGDAEYLAAQYEWEYTEDGKILSELSREFSYKKKDYRKPASVFEKKQEFLYNDDADIPPDYQYFENGVMKMRTVYASKAEYRTTIFFSSSLSVTTYYENGIRKKELFERDGVVLRTELYE